MSAKKANIPRRTGCERVHDFLSDSRQEVIRHQMITLSADDDDGNDFLLPKPIHYYTNLHLFFVYLDVNV